MLRTAQFAWMQSVERPEVALAVVSPRRFVPTFQLRVARRELESLGLGSPRQAHVLAIVTNTEQGLSLNLKAPVVLNLEGRVGRQVIGNGELPVRHPLQVGARALKRTA